MKKCPHCHEDIHDEESDCPFCEEPLDKPVQQNIKTRYQTYVIVIALLTLGPLGLPLVWFHPTYKLATKALVTIGVTIFTIISLLATKLLLIYLLKTLAEHPEYRIIKELLKQYNL